MTTNRLYYTTSKIYVQAGTTFNYWLMVICLIITTQSKTGFTILKTVAKKLQSTICVSRRKNMTRFTRQKINNILNTSYFRLVSLNAGKENLMRL